MIDPSLHVKQYVTDLKKAFALSRDADTAIAQAKYMRDLFQFYGLKRPERNLVQKDFLEQCGIPLQKDLVEVLRLCFKAEHREVQYFALDILTRCIKKQDESFVKVLEELIQTKSWWDSVDYLASISGKYFLKHHSLIPEISDRWIAHDNLWLNRVAIIFQLAYKDKTDETLLYGYIKMHSQSDEFFIQKASGWALRQHSKHRPESVVDFIESHALPSLTVREGLKHIRKTNPALLNSSN